MPELPEVETIRRQLAFELRGKRIKDIEVKLAKLVKCPLVFFKKNTIGAKITEVKRRAKILVFALSNGFTILIHLKLTGQLIYKKKSVIKVGGHPIKKGTEGLPNKYTHIIFIFTDGSKLFFNDLRQFGYLIIVKTDKLEDIFQKKKLGPEPLDKRFTLSIFRDLLSKRKTAKIKPLLMDQTFIAGIGNIYAAEVCFSAGIRPTRPAGLLKEEEIRKLFQAIKKILSAAVRKQGSSPDTYVDAYGQPGRYMPLLKVYGRKGEKCYLCGTRIKTIILAGRSTAFCPKCQH